MGVIWFRQIDGIGYHRGKRRQWYIPITWQGALYDLVQYSLVIYFIFFNRSLRNFGFVLLILVVSFFVKRAKGRTVKESVEEEMRDGN